MNHFNSPIVQTNDTARKFTPNNDDNEDGDGGLTNHGWGEELQKISRRSRHRSASGAAAGGGTTSMPASMHSSHHRQRHRGMMGMELDVISSHHNMAGASSQSAAAADDDFLNRLCYPQLEQDDADDGNSDNDEFASEESDDEFGRSLQDDWLHYSSSDSGMAGSSSLSMDLHGASAIAPSSSAASSAYPSAGPSSMGSSFPFFPQTPYYHPTVHKHR